MSWDDRRPEARFRLERLVARQLDYGTWLASTMIALGMGLGLFERHAAGAAPLGGMSLSTTLVMSGLALIILLPVIRVVLMAGAFLREGDYRHAAIACAVLATIATGLAVAPHLASMP
jgi:uncharacterized membrane protein